MSLVKIANACAVECEWQQADTINDLVNMLKAYERVQTFGDNLFSSSGGFISLARDIEPKKNDGYFFRVTPVTFANGGSSASPTEIPRLMNRLVAEIKFFFDSPPVFGVDAEVMQLTKQFLWIHPFSDGNGRCGFLLWNYLMGTLDEPLALPDFGW